MRCKKAIILGLDPKKRPHLHYKVILTRHIVKCNYVCIVNFHQKLFRLGFIGFSMLVYRRFKKREIN